MFPVSQFFINVFRLLFSGDVEQVEDAKKITVRIFKSITLVHEPGMVLLEVRDQTIKNKTSTTSFSDTYDVSLCPQNRFTLNNNN